MDAHGCFCREELAAKKEGIKTLSYEVVEPVSARGSRLTSVPFLPQESVCVQGVHLPFHFCCVFVSSEQVRRELSKSDEEKAGAVMYLNSLNRSKIPKVRSIDSISSPILHDMLDGVSELVIDLPCVQQPQGNSCGMATLVNAMLALIVCSFEELLNKGLNDALVRYQLPFCSAWTNSDFVAATRIVVKFFEAGADSVPKLSILLRRVSFAVAEARKEVSQQNNRRKSSKKPAASRILNASQSKISTFFKKKSADNPE